MQESINSQSMLKVGTILRGIYRIDSYLSSGGFGNTYIATNIEFDERYAIKEFFMKGVTQRDNNQNTISVSNAENKSSFIEQKEKFKKEARRLRKLDNPHIVKVHDLFEENGTAYYVMDYVDGENLAERLKRTGRPMTESEIRLLLPQIFDALRAVHEEGFCHLDIKPSNIMLEKGDVVKLIDFGASKQLGANGTLTTNDSTAFAQTPGFAPREQTEQNLDKIGPWTDIYALGATLYNLLTNKRPPLPTDIDDDISEDKHEALPFPDGISDDVKACVLQMMKPHRLQRPQSIATIMEAEMYRKDGNKQTHKQQPTTQGFTVHDEEETIIAESQPHRQVIISESIPHSNLDSKTTRVTNDKKAVIDFTIPIYSKEEISLLSFGVLCCIPIMLVPFFNRNEASFESSTLFDLYKLCYTLIPILSSILYVLLSKGLWKQNKIIAVLLALCSILELSWLANNVLGGNLNWWIFWGKDFCGYLCGFFMLTRCWGNIIKLGKIFIAYFSIIALLNILVASGIYHKFNLTIYTLFEIAVWGIDILWIYGMWWMLTRRESEQ